MEKEIVSLNEEERILLLEVLGYKVNEKGTIINQNNEEVECPFTKKSININTLSIMPGSLVLMNTNPLTLSEYFYQYPDE